MTVRPARLEDAAAMAVVHYHAWVAGYAELIPAESIAPLGEGRVRRWERIIGRADPADTVVVAERDDEVVGLATSHPSAPRLVELQTMYVHPDHWGAGVGRELMEYLRRGWSRQGVCRASLWVLETNRRGRGFYEAFGWRAAGERRIVEMGGVELPVVRYELLLTSGPDGTG